MVSTYFKNIDQDESFVDNLKAVYSQFVTIEKKVFKAEASGVKSDKKVVIEL